MSLMSQSLLMDAQSLRLEGDLDGSIALLRVVVSQCNADAFDISREGHTQSNKEKHLSMQLWEMASYQLALLLLQKSGRCRGKTSEEGEADRILSKMWYKLRLSVEAFGYPPCGDCAIDTTKCNLLETNDASKLPLVIIDDALPRLMFDALQFSLRPRSRYWTEFYVKTNICEGRNDDKTYDKQRIFASHNIPLHSTNLTAIQSINKSGSLLEQVAILVQNCLSHHFPSITAATSVELWSHRRPPDAHHQLHYDVDEIRLWEQKQRHSSGLNSTTTTTTTTTTEIIGNKRQKVGLANGNESSMSGDLCPIVSCVLTVHVPNETKTCERCGRCGDGAPTLVCNQYLFGNRTNDGFLCYPRLNRLVAFDGSLLHGVVPGIPSKVSSEDGDNHRITLMMGFWRDVTLTVPHKASHLAVGPNMPMSSSLRDEFKPSSIDQSILSSHISASRKHVNPVLVRHLWTDISNEYANDSEMVSSGNGLRGRFFLKSSNPTEIDKEILGL